MNSWESKNCCMNTNIVFGINISLIMQLLTFLKKKISIRSKYVFLCHWSTKNIRHKLDHYGIRGFLNKWFQSFLSGRSQYTSIKDKSSNKLTITHCVSHGSVLWPLLFILYTMMHTILQVIQIYSAEINL